MESDQEECCKHNPYSEKGINAYPLGGQQFATKLCSRVNRIDFAANTNSSVLLFKAKENKDQWVLNNSSNDIKVFPQPGERFLDSLSNVPQTLVSGQKIYVYCISEEEGIWTIL